MKRLNNFLLLLLIFCLSLPVQGQIMEKIEEFESDIGTSLEVRYLQTSQKSDLLRLSRELRNKDNFPLVVLDKGDFSRSIGLIRKLQIESVNYLQLTEELTYLDSLSTLQDQAYMSIYNMEHQRTELYKQTNQELNAEIARMSEQIDRTVDLGEKNLKGLNFKNLTKGILGGAIGLSIGLLVGVLANGN